MATSKARAERPSEGQGKRVKREPMSRVDTAWLRMERPTNPMMITGVMMFAEQMTRAQLKRVIQQRFLSYSRFRQKPVDGADRRAMGGGRGLRPGLACAPVRIARKTGAPPEARAGTLRQPVGIESARSSKPLWQFHLVERYQGGSAVVARIHHCYADGIALVQVLLSLTDTSRESSQASRLDKAWLKHDAAPVARASVRSTNT